MLEATPKMRFRQRASCRGASRFPRREVWRSGRQVRIYYFSRQIMQRYVSAIGEYDDRQLIVGVSLNARQEANRSA